MLILMDNHFTLPCKYCVLPNKIKELLFKMIYNYNTKDKVLL